MTLKIIDLPKDFSPYPAGRDRADGRWSAEAFREDLLVPALRIGGGVQVQLDGAFGYGSSFIEEAFGGLVRVDHFDLVDLERRLEITCNEDPTLVDEAWEYIRDAAKSRHRMT